MYEILNFDPIYFAVLILVFSIFTYLKRTQKSQIITRHVESESNAFLNKFVNNKYDGVVIYASETGTAEMYSKRLISYSKKYNWKLALLDPSTIEIEDFLELKKLDKIPFIFGCIATTGDGDPPGNAMIFLDELETVKPNMLANFNYAIFGLGNSTYQQFNASAKKLNKILNNLSGNCVLTHYGDDDKDLEQEFLKWNCDLWVKISKIYGVYMDSTKIIREYDLKLYSEEINKENIHVFSGEYRPKSFKFNKMPFNSNNHYMAEITQISELIKQPNPYNSSCLNISLNIKLDITYCAGDHVGVYVKNYGNCVDYLGKRLNSDLDQIFSLTNTDDGSINHPFPCPTSYRTAFTHYIDINSTVKTNVLEALSFYCSNESESQLLKKMATVDGSDLYKTNIISTHVNICQLLKDMPNVSPPIDILAELLPKLKPRFYSISSARTNENKLNITAKLVKYDINGKTIYGTATGYFNQISKQSFDSEKILLPIFIRSSNFKLPMNSNIPIIMIGPGTGIAPYMGFLEQRQCDLENEKIIGKAILYFGCRSKNFDYLYQEKLENYINNGVLTKINVAFSRDQENKIYVQDLIAQNAKEFYQLIKNENAYIYICGDAKNMAVAVEDQICEVIMKFGNMNKIYTRKYINMLKNIKRYNLDVWS